MDQERELISEEEARKCINRLQGIDLKTASIDELTKLIEKYNLRNPGLFLSKGTTFYRARIPEDRPSNISELSYPPEHLSSLNRANRPNDPMFYACSGAGGAVFELDPNPGEMIAIAKWESTKELTINKVGYTEEVIKKFDSNRDPESVIGDEYLASEPVGNSIMREYLAKIFTQRVPKDKKHRHKLTAAIAEYFRSEGMIDGLIYPAVKSSANYDNFALETDTVDRSLSPMSAEFIEYQGRDEDKGRANIIDTCIEINENKFHWNGHGRKSIIEEDSELEVRINENGQPTFPDEDSEGVNHLFDPDFEY